MKVYSNILTEIDLRQALPSEVGMEITPIRYPRKRARAWIVYLYGYGDRHTRRTNSGVGALPGPNYAATYDDHGQWMARLFDQDPKAVISYWKSQNDFNRGTDYKYVKYAERAKA